MMFLFQCFSPSPTLDIDFLDISYSILKYAWVATQWEQCDQLCNGEQSAIVVGCTEIGTNINVNASYCTMPKPWRACNEDCVLQLVEPISYVEFIISINRWKIRDSGCSEECGRGYRPLSCVQIFRQNNRSQEVDENYCQSIEIPRDECIGSCEASSPSIAHSPGMSFIIPIVMVIIWAKFTCCELKQNLFFY